MMSEESILARQEMYVNVTFLTIMLFKNAFALSQADDVYV